MIELIAPMRLLENQVSPVAGSYQGPPGVSLHLGTIRIFAGGRHTSLLHA